VLRILANYEQELSGVFQMGIYDSDCSVRSILEDCQVRPREFRRSSIRSSRVVDGIDLDRLNERLSTIPVSEIRRRRARMNIFYQEILVSADPDRGISFTSLLMILAHYNVINDAKSLR
jgi:voltage-dependent calcium channel